MTTENASNFWLAPFVPDLPSTTPESDSNSDVPVQLSLDPVSRVIDSVCFVVGSHDFLFASVIDDGADVTIIGINAWRRISVSHPEIRQVRHQFILGDGTLRSSDFAFLTDVVILTSAGPVTVRRHWVHVLECDMPEVLLRRPLLLCLGINIDSLLLHLAENQADVTDNISHEEQSAQLSLTDFDDTLVLGPPSDDELDFALVSVIDDAISEQAPESFVLAFHSLLKE